MCPIGIHVKFNCIVFLQKAPKTHRSDSGLNLPQSVQNAPQYLKVSLKINQVQEKSAIFHRSGEASEYSKELIIWALNKISGGVL